MTHSLDASEVADYLKNHPEFFEHYADVLVHLQIPDLHGDRAISITERQLVALRDRNKLLETKLSELVGFGEENDVIGEKMHELAVAMIRAETFATVAQVLYAHLGDTFLVSHVALRLWGVGSDGGREEFSPVDAETVAFATDLKQPYCGPSAGIEAFAWFGSDVHSLALIPLRRGEETCGLLALGSEEMQRFYPEMGTLYLTRFGDLAAAALLRTLD
jgi:uncharacterized protein YigA (DUF484 family)